MVNPLSGAVELRRRRPDSMSSVAATLGLSSIGTADRMPGHAHDDEYGDAAGNPGWRGAKGVSDGSHELAGEVASPYSG